MNVNSLIYTRIHNTICVLKNPRKTECKRDKKINQNKYSVQQKFAVSFSRDGYVIIWCKQRLFLVNNDRLEVRSYNVLLRSCFIERYLVSKVNTRPLLF